MPALSPYNLDYNVKQLPANNAWQTTVLTGCTSVGSTAAQIDLTPLTRRTDIIIRNLDSTLTIYIGPTNAVTVSGTTQGWPVPPDDEVAFSFGEDLVVWAIVSSGTADGIFLEIA